MSPVVDLHALAAQSEQLVEIAGTGTIEAIPIAKLKFDEYQRDLDVNFVQEIAGKWDPKVAGAIVVNRRPNGTLYVVDGQHRIGAAKTVGETHVLALVYENLTRPQEAAMRVKGNVRHAENPGEAFRAKLIAGDPESKAIATICEEFNTRINTTPRSDSGINGVNTVERIYRRDGGDLLARTFDVITRAWGNVGSAHARADVLGSIAHLLEVNRDEVDVAQLVDKMQQEGTTGLRAKARALQGTWGGSGPINFYRALVEVYNTGTPQRQRLVPKIRGR